jgi:hypothetical protein
MLSFITSAELHPGNAAIKEVFHAVLSTFPSEVPKVPLTVSDLSIMTGNERACPLRESPSSVMATEVQQGRYSRNPRSDPIAMPSASVNSWSESDALLPLLGNLGANSQGKPLFSML